MKKALIGLLIVTAIGMVLIIIGAVINTELLPYGLVVYLVASGIAGFASGTKLTSFFNWERSIESSKSVCTHAAHK